eukprot:CAMPEP_0196590754 /NCGR_PEP_ID=MMETSP1081-20130531/67438_1 /TAXON_ID=36882 /ORGANISM="Pyramimonas amylifera, Strain CCMP720" /LENGTH=243 /DNA_ID=CAMNT_0041913943 /DNA_START=40 /DNA_END=768 /DNA_ORIENTATION=-
MADDFYDSQPFAARSPSLDIPLQMTREGNFEQNSRMENIVDLKALSGLRGLVAMHILIFHCFIYSEFRFNLQGSVSMPIFFLLSGFTLAITYRDVKFQDCCRTHTETQAAVSANEHVATPARVMSPAKFYRNRFARVAPVYYLTTLLTVPLVFLGQAGSPVSALPGSLVVSFLGVSTWFLFAGGGPLNGPSWTVSTLALWWWFFPCTIGEYLRIRTCSLMKYVTILMWVQFFVGVVLVVGIGV